MDSLEQRRAAYLQNIEDVIARAGWFIQGVFGGAGEPGATGWPFMYTVGLHDKGVPELLTFSLPPDAGMRLINAVGRYLVERQAAGLPLEGRVDLEQWLLPFYVMPVKDGAADDYATIANGRSEGQAKYLQLVWPDAGGKFPWDAGMDEKMRKAQPVLYEMPESRPETTH